jgi:hypothetical protein
MARNHNRRPWSHDVHLSPSQEAIVGAKMPLPVAMHGMLMRRADVLAGCTEGSDRPVLAATRTQRSVPGMRIGPPARSQGEG